MSAPSRGNMVEVDGSVGTTAAMAVVAPATNMQRNYVVIQNTHATQTLGWTCTTNITPVIGSVGFTLLPGAYYSAAEAVFQGPINVIGSAAGTTYHIGSF